MSPKELRAIEDRLRKVEAALYSVSKPVDAIVSARLIMLSACAELAKHIETDRNGEPTQETAGLNRIAKDMVRFLNETDAEYGAMR